MKRRKVTKQVRGAKWSIKVTGTRRFVDRTIAVSVPKLKELAKAIRKAETQIKNERKQKA